MESKKQSSTFISYAQINEDVVLFRALKNVEVGFYVDVGAHDPTYHSTTKAFYERGWSGINIEPVGHYFDRLEKERVRDVNLKVAAGNQQGEMRFFEILDTGLSTANEEFARNHKKAGFKVEERVVEVTTLDQICSEYKPDVIHFLKIDVEGLEKDVLEGLDLTRMRPWIICAEATVPLSEEEAFQEWEHLLTSNRYLFALSDGLNRFYCAQEHSELLPVLSEPSETVIFSRSHEKSVSAYREPASSD